MKQRLINLSKRFPFTTLFGSLMTINLVLMLLLGMPVIIAVTVFHMIVLSAFLCELLIPILFDLFK